MVSGRLAGMAVRPFPRQSTMLLLQEHMGGQEPDARLQGWTKAEPPWPEGKQRKQRLQRAFVTGPTARRAERGRRRRRT